MIPSLDGVRAVIDALNAHELPHFLTGWLVSNAYGTPRFTIDADFAVIADDRQIHSVLTSLSNDFEREPQLSFETVTGKTQCKTRHKGSGLLIELFEMKDDPFDKSRMARRRRGLCPMCAYDLRGHAGGVRSEPPANSGATDRPHPGPPPPSGGGSVRCPECGWNRPKP